jgi:hypothetical protein
MTAQELYDIMAGVDPDSEVVIEVGEWKQGEIPPSLGFMIDAKGGERNF